MGNCSRCDWLQISKNVVKLCLGYNYVHRIQLPKHLKYLKMMSTQYKNLVLTPNIKFLTTNGQIKLCVDNIPSVSHVKLINRIVVYKCFDVCENLPNGVQNVSYYGFEFEMEKLILSNLPNTACDVERVDHHHNIHLNTLDHGHEQVQVNGVSLCYHQAIYHMIA